MYPSKELGGSYVADAPGVTTCVIGSTVTEPRLLVAVTLITSVVGPVGAGLEVAPVSIPGIPVPPPGIHVGNLIVITDWAMAVVGRSPSAKAPLRDFILRKRLKTRGSGYSNIKIRGPLLATCRFDTKTKTKRA